MIQRKQHQQLRLQVSLMLACRYMCVSSVLAAGNDCEQAYFTADILTCHSRRSTDETDNTDNVNVPVSYSSEPAHTGPPLHEMQLSFMLLNLLVHFLLRHVKMSAMEKGL